MGWEERKMWEGIYKLQKGFNILYRGQGRKPQSLDDANNSKGNGNETSKR